jgi:hypothetical protein
MDPPQPRAYVPALGSGKSAVILTKGGHTARFETTIDGRDRVTLKNSNGEFGILSREEALQRISKLVATGWKYQGPAAPSPHARMIHQPPTGRLIFAAHERDHHITTSGRRALDREQFALPPGPEEKRRGIWGRLPIDTLPRARNALQRASQMQKRGHITAGQLAEVRRVVHRAWPSIEVHAHAHATMGGGGNFKSTERPFTEADVARLARQALVRSHGNIAKAGQYASNMADRYESAKWERVMDYILKQSK